MPRVFVADESTPLQVEFSLFLGFVILVLVMWFGSLIIERTLPVLSSQDSARLFRAWQRRFFRGRVLIPVNHSPVALRMSLATLRYCRMSLAVLLLLLTVRLVWKAVKSP